MCRKFTEYVCGHFKFQLPVFYFKICLLQNYLFLKNWQAEPGMNSFRFVYFIFRIVQMLFFNPVQSVFLLFGAVYHIMLLERLLWSEAISHITTWKILTGWLCILKQHSHQNR